MGARNPDSALPRKEPRAIRNIKTTLKHVEADLEAPRLRRHSLPPDGELPAAEAKQSLDPQLVTISTSAEELEFPAKCQCEVHSEELSLADTLPKVQNGEDDRQPSLESTTSGLTLAPSTVGSVPVSTSDSLLREMRDVGLHLRKTLRSIENKIAAMEYEYLSADSKENGNVIRSFNGLSACNRSSLGRSRDGGGSKPEDVYQIAGEDILENRRMDVSLALLQGLMRGSNMLHGQNPSSEVHIQLKAKNTPELQSLLRTQLCRYPGQQAAHRERETVMLQECLFSLSSLTSRAAGQLVRIRRKELDPTDG